MKSRKRWIWEILLFIISLLVISLLGWNFLREKIYVSDSDFIMHQNILSPDGKHRMIEFEIDLGAWGSHGGRAITPPNFQNLNLAGYKIPRCYESFGWTESNELIVSIYEDSRNTKLCDPKQLDLKTGEVLQGVRVQVVNAEEFLSNRGIYRRKTGVPQPETK